MILQHAALSAIEPGAGSLRERYRRGVRGGSVTAVFLRTVWLVTRKDLLIEVRSREIVYTTLFFAVSCVLVFAFGFVRDGRPVQDAAAGILWIAIAFSGTLALGRAFERERQSETLRALMMAPVDRPALYVGKLLGVLMLLAVVEAIIVPLVGADVPGAAVRASRCSTAACSPPARSGSLPSGRCSPRCSSVRAAVTFCCRSCCIRLQFQ